MDSSLLGSSVHGFSQARILEWVAISSSRGSSKPVSPTHLLHCKWFLYQLSHQGNPENLYMDMITHMGFPDGSVVKNLPATARGGGDTGLIPRSGRSPGGGNGNPL